MLSSLAYKYKYVKNEIDDAISPKRKLFLIIEFFKECENQGLFPPHKTFIYDFTPYLLELFQSENINFIDPDYMIKAKYLFILAQEAYEGTEGYELIKVQIEKTIGYIDLQLIKLFFYLGETEEGLAVISKLANGKSKDSIKYEDRFNYNDKKATDSNVIRKNPFTLIVRSVYEENRVFEILKEMRKEIEKIKSCSNNELNLMLVESYFKDNNTIDYFGSVQNLICSINRKSNKRGLTIIFNSYQKHKLSGFSEALENISFSSREVLRTLRISEDFKNCEVNIRYENNEYMYAGNSFSLGAVILIICSYLKFKEKYTQYYILGNTAFTGAVDACGNVLPVSDVSIKAKVEAAYFSWIKYCVIPYKNYTIARNAYEELRSKFPKKDFELIPVRKIDEIFRNPQLIRKENQRTNEYVKNKIKKHIVPFSVVSSICILALSIFIIYNIFPKHIKPLPKANNDMYLIYAPDRDTSWFFHNVDFFGGDTIDFGDVAIGDHWYPSIEFWNNSENEENFNVFIDGENKEDFQITYLRNVEQSEPTKFIVNDKSQLIYIKFVPISGYGSKKASLIFENTETGSRKKIFLNGTAKKLSSGYCIEIDNCRKLLVLEPGINLLQNNFTISFWIKPNLLRNDFGELSIFRVENNPLTNNKLSLLLNHDSTLTLYIHGSKSNEINGIYARTNNKFKFKEWNYVGISIKDTTASLVLNEKYCSTNIRSNALRKIIDCIYFGHAHPSEREKSNNITNYYNILLDDFKILNIAIPPKDLISNRFQQSKFSEYCTVDYNFDDATPKKIFDNSINDLWPNIYGGINRGIDSTQPFYRNRIRIPSSNANNKVFKRNNKGYLKLNRNLFKPFSSFTLQCDFKIDRNKIKDKNELYLVPFFINRSGLDIYYGINNDSLCFSVLDVYKGKYIKETIYADFISGWNRYTISYNIDSNTICFYLNNQLLKQFNKIEILNISENYMGISFSLVNYFASPRFSSKESEIDNIKLFNRSLASTEIYLNGKEGLVAYWTFENTENELVYDEINKIPLLMWGDYELVNDNIQ